MKTIEERAERYEHWADQIANRWDKPEEHIPFKEQIKRAFIAGAKSQHAELTRWHDPKEVIYELNHIVLTKWKYKDGSGEIISIGGFNGEEWDAHSIMYPELFEIIGWREIHE